MFMLYAIGLGLAAGVLFGGRFEGLVAVRVRWSRIALVALLVQVALFSAPVSSVVGDGGAFFYVGSSAVVLGVVLRNLGLPGLPIVALGATSNLAAISANGGWMPASPDAMRAVGATLGPNYSNSREIAAPALAVLTDTFALPSWLPLTNVFSLGDVLIGLGIAMAIVVLMRRATTARAQRPATADERTRLIVRSSGWTTCQTRRPVGASRHLGPSARHHRYRCLVARSAGVSYGATGTGNRTSNRRPSPGRCRPDCNRGDVP